MHLQLRQIDQAANRIFRQKVGLGDQNSGDRTINV